MKRLSLLFLCCGTLLSCAAYAAPHIYVGTAAQPLERFAATELQRFLYASTGERYDIDTIAEAGGRAEGFVLGTPQSLPRLAEKYPFSLEAPRFDGYLFHSLNDGNLLVVAGSTPRAVQYGVYGLLEDLGIGFYLDGERVPTGLKLKRLPRLHESRSPLLGVRGTLLRDTYFVGPAAWSFADYKQYIDRLAELRINFLAFYASVDGPFVDDLPLPDTSKGPWHNAPLPTSRYLAGTGQYFADDRFGGPGSDADTAAEGVREARDTLRRAFAYARTRGMRVGIGFDAVGDPTDPAVQSAFETRLRGILEDYPTVEGVWIYAPELAAVSATDAPPSRTLLAAYGERWATQFASLSNEGRRAQAIRHSLFLLQAQRVLEALRPDVQLVNGAWGGDNSWRFTDFFQGMDSILPSSVAFSALDDMPAGKSIAAGYGTLAHDRDKWPTIWLEHDGDLWMPQPNLASIAASFEDAIDKGCSGLFGLHWRTRTFDDPAGYLARLSWDSQLTPEDYLARRARDLYGAALGADLAPYLVRLEGLGYRWVGGLGQYEPAPYIWGGGKETRRTGLVQVGTEFRAKLNQDKLLPDLLPDITAPLDLGRDLLGVPLGLVKAPLELGRRVVDLPLGIGRDLAGAVLPPSAPPEWRTALADTYAQLRFVAAFDRAARALSEGQRFQQAQLAETLHLFARNIQSKGELGALAEMNAKAWAAARERLGGDSANLSLYEALPDVYRSHPQLIVLPDRVIVVGVEPDRCRPVLKARPLGERHYVEQPLKHIGRGTYALDYPEHAKDWGAFEYGVEVEVDKGETLSWPVGFPDVPATAPATVVTDSPAPTAPSAPNLPAPALHAVADADRGVVRLTWDARPGCAYTVLRNGETLAAVYDGWFVDSGPVQNNRYELKARFLGADSAVSATADVWGFVPPLPDPPAKVLIASRGGANLLEWDSDSPQAAEYVVTKYGPGSMFMKDYRVRADFGHRLRVADAAEKGQALSYTVAGAASDGRTGPASRPVGIIVSPQPLKPVAVLSLLDESKLLEALSLVGANSLALGGAGWSELPAQPAWDPDKPLTLSLRVRLTETYGMPVLVSRGPWNAPAYYLQAWNGGVRFHLSGIGTLDAGTLTPGQWQQVTAVYGGDEMQVYVDGKLAGRGRAGQAQLPALSEAILARYGVRGKPGFVEGALDDFRFYRAILAPQEIESLGK
jgi:hypothetical protein